MIGYCGGGWWCLEKLVFLFIISLGSDFFISVNNGRKGKKEVDNLLFLSYYKCPFWVWIVLGGGRRHTHGDGGLRGYEGQMCVCGSWQQRFCFQVDMETVFWLAQFSLVLFCWAAPPPLDWIKRSRLREGIGRVGKIIGSSAYIFLFFIILT